MTLTPDQIDAKTDNELCIRLRGDSPEWWPSNLVWIPSKSFWCWPEGVLWRSDDEAITIVTQAVEGWLIRDCDRLCVSVKVIGGEEWYTYTMQIEPGRVWINTEPSRLKAAVKAWLAVKGEA